LAQRTRPCDVAEHVGQWPQLCPGLLHARRRCGSKRLPRTLERGLERGHLIEAERPADDIAPLLWAAMDQGLKVVLGNDRVRGMEGMHSDGSEGAWLALDKGFRGVDSLGGGKAARDLCV